MNKLNKKGFTLIEMLVVIAIIAVLVAIIIPTVSSATTKAAAAADAANLRSLVAEATTDYLADVDEDTGLVVFDADAADGSASQFTCPNAPAAKSKGVSAAATITLNTTTGLIEAKFGDLTIADFARAAEDGEAPTHKS